MMVRIHDILVRLCLLSLTAVLTVHAASCAKDYVAYTTRHLGYNAFIDAQGQLVGVSIDFYRELAKRSACKIAIEDVPPARLDALNNDNRVAILALAANRHRPNRTFLPVISMSTDMLVRSDLHIDTEVAARSNARVVFGRVQGLTYGEWGNNFLEQLPTSRVDVSPDVDVLYRKLATGRIDATFGFSLMYLRNYEENGLHDRIKIIPLRNAPRLVVGVVLSNSLVDPHDIQLLSAAVETMRSDGTMERILARWIGDQTAREQIWRTDRDNSTP